MGSWRAWIPDATAGLGLALLTAALLGVDWRLALGVLGAILTALGLHGARQGGGS